MTQEEMRTRMEGFVFSRQAPPEKTELTEEDRVLIRKGKWPWPEDQSNRDGGRLRSRRPVSVHLDFMANDGFGKDRRHGNCCIIGTMDEMRQLRDSLTKALDRCEDRLPRVLERGFLLIEEVVGVEFAFNGPHTPPPERADSVVEMNVVPS